MRNWLLLLLCFGTPALFAQRYLQMIEAGTFSLQEIQQEANAYFKEVGTERGRGYNPYKRWEYVASMELDANGVKIPNNELAQRARAYRRAEKQRQLTESGQLSAGNWKQLGPTYWNATSSWSPGLGRVTSIGLDEQNPQHLIVGSPTGGVWKTLDGCNTWTPLTDDFSTVDVYSLEISPFNANHYLWGSTSGKIFRSQDGGQSWSTTSNVSGSGKVIRILYHPVDPNIVYAVSESNGLFRSVNAGQNWTAMPGVSSIKGQDVEFKPGDPNTIYFSGINVFKSANGGNSFTQITGFGTADNNHKMIGVTPANPAVVYVVESIGGRFNGFYKSTDSGDSFTKLHDDSVNFFGYSATGDDDRGQAPRDMDVAAHPFDAEEVHIAGIHTWKSHNGGLNFELTSHWVPSTAASLGVGYNHADVDLLKFYGDRLWVGTDGGIFSSDDHAETYQNRSVGLGIREFYKIGVSKTSPNVVSGGSQDNGTSVMRTNNRLWVDWLGADGMETFVDWNNANILYGTSQYGSMYKSTNQGNTRSSISKPPDVEDGAWVTPFEQDPQVSGTIYVAFEDVWKSPNSGNSWVKISDLADGNFNHLKLAPSDRNRIYAARGSNLYTTANGGGNWATTTKAWGTSSISFITVHPQQPQRVVIVTSSNVYQSMDAGATWTTMTAGLPSGTKYCAIWENTGKNGLYVGGFGFVAYTNDDLNGQWVGFFDGLPNVRVYELEINYISNTIFAGTYGRGLWESPLYQPAPPTAAFRSDQQEGCQNLVVQFTDESTNTPNFWEWQFEGGNPATSNDQHPLVNYTAPGSYKVSLRVVNNAGENTLEKTDFITVVQASTPLSADVENCGAGEISLSAQATAGENLQWYATEQATTPVFSGAQWQLNLASDTTFYVSASVPYQQIQTLGPATNAIGTGSDHAGDQYLLLNVLQPVRLQSALVYAAGAAFRVFQLRDASGVVVQEKTIYVEDGATRVTLDFDIPTGNGWQIGCPATANLYRNNSGPAYPYTLPGLVSITGSTAGPDYYYYLYDLAFASTASCESARVSVQVKIYTPLEPPAILLEGNPHFCPGDTLSLTVTNACPDCVVQWSNGATGPSIRVAEAGQYTATMSNPLAPVCGISPVSDTIVLIENAVPAEEPEVQASATSPLCPGQTLELSVSQICADCQVRWSDGTVAYSLTVSTGGVYTAVFENDCGAGPESAAWEINTLPLPPSPEYVQDGASVLCPGESVVLSVQNVCAGCIISWNHGADSSVVELTQAGEYVVTQSNTCGTSQPSAAFTVSVSDYPTTAELALDGAIVLCPGDSSVLTVVNPCAGCVQQWSTGATGILQSLGNAGVYTVIQLNQCGASQPSDPIILTEKSLPEAPEIQANGLTIFCEGDSVVLNATFGCLDCQLTWSNGSTEITLVISESGMFTASLSNVCGTGPASAPVWVSEQPLLPAPEIVALGNTALCPGDSVMLQVSSQVCPECVIQWSDGAQGIIRPAVEAGVYTAQLLDPNSLCGAGLVSNALEVSVSPPFVPVVQLQGLCNLLAPGGSNYQWYFNGLPINGAVSSEWTAENPGLYAVSMTGPDGCSGTSVPVFAEACVSAVFAPGAAIQAIIYPNPAQQRIFLETNFPAASEIQLELFTTDGRKVASLLQSRLNAGKQVQDILLPELPNGAYLCRLLTDWGIQQSVLMLNR
ncbi:MAG: T9SS type A sorting domain-containing protein [Chitinophagales bacterium]|nr:T9SS type A sorting domain-containing protein [Chitinophagales bacterium]